MNILPINQAFIRSHDLVHDHLRPDLELRKKGLQMNRKTDGEKKRKSNGFRVWEV